MTLQQEGRGLGGNYEYIIQEDIGDETFTYTVDRYGNVIGAEIFGLNIILEPKEQAFTLDAKNI